MFECIDCHKFTGTLEEVTDHAMTCLPVAEDAEYVAGALEDETDWVERYARRPNMAEEIYWDYR